MSGDGSNPWTVTRQDGVAVVMLGAGRDAMLTPAARAGLIATLDAAEADTEVRAIVLAAAGGRDFVKSDDPRGALQTEASPTSGDAASRVAACTKPVVACLAGRISGTGAALAVAAHWRVAAPDARIGWGDVTQGRVPAAGATQRLPRLVGARAALDLLLSGRAFPLTKPMLEPLTDAMAEDSARALDEAVAFAGRADLATRPVDDRRDGLLDGAQFVHDIAERRDKVGWDETDAAAQTVAAVEAALLLPIAAGLDFEEDAAARCAAAPRARALHRMTWAERDMSAAHASGARTAEPLTIAGHGVAAAGLALAALDAGQHVRLVGAETERTAKQIGATYEHAQARKRMSSAQRDERLARLIVGGDPADLAPGTPVVLTDNTSGTLDWPGGLVLGVTAPEIAEHLAQPVDAELAIAMPAHARRLVELRAAGGAVGPALPAALVRAGRLPVVSTGEGPMALARLWAALDAAADRLVVAGVPPERIDDALRSRGWGALPFIARDAAGLSNEAADPALQALFADVPLGALDAAMVTAGRTGRMGGAGYYDHAGGKPVADPSVTAILSDIADPSDPGWSGDDIAGYLLLALANECLRLVDDGTVQRAEEADLVAVHGLGVPRQTGGPLGHAEALGLPKAERSLRDLGQSFGPLWQPHPGWARRVRDGQREIGRGLAV